MSRPARVAAVAATVLLLALAPIALADDVKSEAKIKNKEPVVEAIEILTPDADPGTPGHQIGPSPGGRRLVGFEVTGSDGNGWRDLGKAKWRVLASDGTEIAAGDVGPNEPGRNRTTSYTVSYPLQYWQAPGTYAFEVVVKDKPGAEALGTREFEVIASLAMALDDRAISFGGSDGSLEPGTDNHAAPASVSVRNVGNVRLDLGFSGTDLKNDAYKAAIPVSRIHYSSHASMSPETSLSESLQTDGAFDLAAGEGASKPVYFALHVPTGDEQYLPATTYRGAITLSAVVDS